MNKSGLVDEVKSRLGVSTGRAKSLVDAVLGEIAAAQARGELSIRGLDLVLSEPPAKKPAVKRPAAKKTATKKTATKKPATKKPAAKRAPAAAPPTVPHIVPYEPAHDPLADAIAAAAAEAARPVEVAEPWGDSTRVVATMPEPELQEEPDTLAYSSGTADPDETIAERLAD